MDCYLGEKRYLLLNLRWFLSVYLPLLVVLSFFTAFFSLLDFVFGSSLMICLDSLSSKLSLMGSQDC